MQVAGLQHKLIFSMLAWTAAPADDDTCLVVIEGLLYASFDESYALFVRQAHEHPEAAKLFADAWGVVVLIDLKTNTCACAVPLTRFVADESLSAKVKKKKHQLHIRHVFCSHSHHFVSKVWPSRPD